MTTTPSGAGDALLAKIDEAIEGWEKHKVHVSDDLLPVMPERARTAQEMFTDLGIDVEVSPWQDKMIEAVLAGQKLQYLPTRNQGRTWAEKQMRKYDEVYGTGFFDEAPLFGRQDAGLDDLEPEGPIVIYDEAMDLTSEDLPSFDAEEHWKVQRISAVTGMPVRRRTIRVRLGRSLRACASSVLSHIPGIRS